MFTCKRATVARNRTPLLRSEDDNPARPDEIARGKSVNPDISHSRRLRRKVLGSGDEVFLHRSWSGSSAVCAGFHVGSRAADLSRPSQPVFTKAPPIESVNFDWSGFYAGAHAGYDWGRAHVIDNGVLTENAVPMNGAIGGLLAGINWQAGRFVYGLEGDFGVSDLHGQGTLTPPPPPPPPPPPLLPNKYDVNLSGNLRVRVGVAVMPTTLIYAAGGLAVADFKFRENSGPIQHSEVLTGWTIGAGIDQAFTKNLIGRVEYLYADYGHKDFALAPGDTYNIGFKSQTARAALMWKF